MLAIFYTMFVLTSCAAEFIVKHLGIEENFELLKEACAKKKEMVSEELELGLRYKRIIFLHLRIPFYSDYLYFAKTGEDEIKNEEKESNPIQYEESVKFTRPIVKNIENFRFKMPYSVSNGFFKKTYPKYSQPQSIERNSEKDTAENECKSYEISDEDLSILIDLLEEHFKHENYSIRMCELLLDPESIEAV